MFELFLIAASGLLLVDMLTRGPVGTTQREVGRGCGVFTLALILAAVAVVLALSAGAV